jgi:hypothetical protein
VLAPESVVIPVLVLLTVTATVVAEPETSAMAPPIVIPPLELEPMVRFWVTFPEVAVPVTVPPIVSSPLLELEKSNAVLPEFN